MDMEQKQAALVATVALPRHTSWGAVVVVVGLRMKVQRGVAMSLGAGVCFLLRMVAAWQHWNLPKVIVR